MRYISEFAVLMCGALVMSASAPLMAQSSNGFTKDDAVHVPTAARRVSPLPPTQIVTRRVSPDQTPSGFRVPRYVSLKYGEVNGRSGPSTAHPVVWRYSRRGLPLIVVAETETWRKVRDQSGDESWMHRRTLDGKHMVIALTDVMLRSKPRETASAKAVAAKDSLLALLECAESGSESDWCKVKADTGHQGYVRAASLWGASPL